MVTRYRYICKNKLWVWSGNTTITICRQTHCIAKKCHTTITRHQEDKQSKESLSISSPSRWLQHENGHKSTHNNYRIPQLEQQSTTNQQQHNPCLRTDSSQSQMEVSWVGCGTWLYRLLIFAPLLTLNVFYWYQIFALDSAVVEAQTW